jgi:hypothetical protein
LILTPAQRLNTQNSVSVPTANNGGHWPLTK